MVAIAFAKKYNAFTGATINHIDVEEMGFMEYAQVEHAMKFMSAQ